MKKITKENTIVVSSAIFTVVAFLHLLRLVTGSELFVEGYIIPSWVSALAMVLSAGLAILNLSILKEKTKVFWLKYVLVLVVFDALFALIFWINNLFFFGISPTSFLFIFIFDVLLTLFLFYYINKMKSLLRK
jgi:hypothetical protein